MTYRTYEIKPPSPHCHYWRGLAKLRGTFDCRAATEHELKSQIDIEMNQFYGVVTLHNKGREGV